MKRDAPHTGFSPRADRPFALSGSARDAPGQAAPSEPDATPCARALHRTGETIMRAAQRAGISFLGGGGQPAIRPAVAADFARLVIMA